MVFANTTGLLGAVPFVTLTDSHDCELVPLQVKLPVP